MEYVPDLLSHKKYYFALEQCIARKTPLIVIDDDFLYPPWFLAHLLEAVDDDRNAIWCYRAKEMQFGEQCELKPYTEWPFADHHSPEARIFFTSGGGTFLPVEMLKQLREAGRRFEDVCPRADDVWLNYVASKSGIRKRMICETSTNFTPLDVPVEQTLWSQNATGGNDAQILATYDAETLAKIAGRTTG